MATVTYLPDEIIATILENKNISMEDIINLKSTCKRLQHITFSTKFWEKKLFQRFPMTKRIHNKKRLKKNHLEASLKYIEELRRYVSLMSSNNIQDIKEMELNGLLCSIAQHSTIYRFVLHDINRIISAQSLSCHNWNCTFKYYFNRIYHLLKQYRLAYKQIKFIPKPKEKQPLKKQIIIIAQHFQPSLYGRSSADTIFL
ncbi:uncharacterized protein LOC112637395 [Camponotus floridanus]|uniref:uncharacterized protein LOC112637395 n=1 Tax=Camponotus floridanus TaxID=104421 RepID=UPI000DC6860F|nr:uncharacterized protein LOC112637395 [Camponotus floridanus]